MEAILHIGGFEVYCLAEWHSARLMGREDITMTLTPRDHDKGGLLMQLLWFGLMQSEKETVARTLKHRNVYIECDGAAFDLVSLGTFDIYYGEPQRVSYDSDETYRTHPPITTYKEVRVVRRVRPTVEQVVTDLLVVRPVLDDEDEEIKGFAVMLGRFRIANAKTQDKASAKRLAIFQGIRWLLGQLGIDMDVEVRKEQPKNE